MTRRVGVERERIERVVHEQALTLNGHVCKNIPTVEVIELLRRELAQRDARVRRMVQAVNCDARFSGHWRLGFEHCKQQILQALTTSRKGRR
jgi:hypothetical protein